MYGLEELDDGEYCVHLPDGAMLEVVVTDDGKLSQEMTRYDNNSQRTITESGLSVDLHTFITARTGKEFE